MSGGEWGDPYYQQAMNASRRGIKWEFTRETWYRFWEDSGKMDQRGVGPDKYCMARIADEGPYSPWNCYVTLFGENAVEPQVLEKRRQTIASRPSDWVPLHNYEHLRTRDRHPKRKGVIAPDGTPYPSIKLASEATGVEEHNVRRWSQAEKHGWSRSTENQDL